MDAKELALIQQQKDLEQDIHFISNEIIAEQLNGKFCKYCDAISAVTVTNLNRV